MPNYIFGYHGGSHPETPEEGQAVMAAWKAWMGDIGASIADMGAPVGMSKTVSTGGVADNGGSNTISGYTVITADDMDGALALAKGCPICDSGGSVEIAELMSMSMDGK